MKKSQLQRVIDGQWLIVALAAFLGALVFIAVYGVQVLVPTNVDWLLAGGDLSQHYIGWEFFRNSAWTFPLGVARDLAYPHGISITFMDSIPLFAIPMKLFGTILPEHFQYFGWWGLFSFAAVGALSARIMQRWTKDPLVIGAIVLFSLASPVVLQRMFMHTSLAGHWVILLAIYGLVWGRRWATGRSILFWSAVLSLSVLIHPYFLVMNVFVMTIALTMRHVSIKDLAIEAPLPLICALFVTWSIGGLMFTNISGANFGDMGYDLAAPVISNGWSLFDNSAYSGRYEMFAYAGIGGVMLVCAAAGLIFARRTKAYEILKRNKLRFVFISLTFVTYLLFSLGPTIRIVDTVIIDYSASIPAFIEKVWAVFRVTARVMWPVYYLVILGSVFVILRWSKNATWARVLIVIMCVMQLVDIFGSSQVQERREKFTEVEKSQYISPLQNPAWHNLTTGRKHVVYLGDLYESKFVAIAQFCIENNLTLNTGYFARKPTSAIESTIEKARGDLKNGSIDNDTIYMYDRPYEAAPSLRSKEINGYIVTVK